MGKYDDLLAEASAPASITQRGNIDIFHRPEIQNGDGSSSTVRSMGINDGGQEVLIPTVVGDRVLDDEEAIAHYRKTGEHLGKFKTAAESDRYANELHLAHEGGGNTPTKRIPFYGPTSDMAGTSAPASKYADLHEAAAEKQQGNVPYHIAREDLPIEQTQYETVDATAKPPNINPNQAEVLGQVGGLMGFGDEITAGMRAVKDTALTPEKRWSNLLDTYRAYKKNAQKDMASAAQQHPGRFALGQIPTMAANAVAASAIAPAALGEQVAAQAPRAVSTMTNLGLSGAQNYGDDTFRTSKVLGDAFAMQAGGEILQKMATPGKTAGQLLQAPQRAVDYAAEKVGGTKIGKVLGQNADELGDMTSKTVKDLRTAQQSYLTEAGKQGAEAQAALGGEDFSSRLAKAASEGRATVGPGRSYGAPLAEFGDDIQKITGDATTEAIQQKARGLIYPSAEDPIFTLKQMGAPGIADEVNRTALRGIADREFETVGRARELLDQWKTAKDAQRFAEQGAQQTGSRLQNIKTGRGALQNVSGIAAAAGGGGSVGGPVGALLAAGIGGKQLGKTAFAGIDMAGELGQQLAQTASIAEQWATRGDALGSMAKWALSGEGPALVARLATLARSPEAQQELQTPQAAP